jgi:signal transduction histidine kinase
MGLRARLAVAAFVTVTFVFAAQFVYGKMPWTWPFWGPCWTDIDGMECRISRKIPIADVTEFGVVLALLALLFPLLVWWVLVPVRRLVTVIGQAGPQNLGYRVRPGHGRDELKGLGRALDTMMDQVAAGYEGQRSFAANASHELRTPLALQRTLIEVGMAEPLSPEQSALLARQLLATNARNEQLIEGLLVLSQADQGLAARTPQQLDRITASVVESHTDDDRTITTDLQPSTVPGDGVLLERLIRNLIHNAIKYNHPGGTVHVAVASGILTVENTGPVVPPDDVARLFEPFARLAPGRIDHSSGSGLGLAIARSIVRAHAGTITATPSEGGGLLVRVQLGP